MNQYNEQTRLVKPLEGEVLPPMRQSAPIDSAWLQSVTPTSTMVVQHHTDAQDRAKGFLWANVPLFAVIALCAVLVSSYSADVPLWSLAALIIFALTFTGAWLVSYIYTLKISPEGVAYYEAKNKWACIRREQQERWNYYNRLGPPGGGGR